MPPACGLFAASMIADLLLHFFFLEMCKLREHHIHTTHTQVLHLLLWQLIGREPPPDLLQFLRVDEMLVDIGDDLTDYEVRGLLHGLLNDWGSCTQSSGCRMPHLFQHQ